MVPAQEAGNAGAGERGRATVRGYSAGPAFTVAGGGPVSVLQRLVFDVWI